MCPMQNLTVCHIIFFSSLKCDYLHIHELFAVSYGTSPEYFDKLAVSCVPYILINLLYVTSPYIYWCPDEFSLKCLTLLLSSLDMITKDFDLAFSGGGQVFDGWRGRVLTVDGSIYHHDAGDLSLTSAWGVLTIAWWDADQWLRVGMLTNEWGKGCWPVPGGIGGWQVSGGGGIPLVTHAHVLCYNTVDCCIVSPNIALLTCLKKSQP